MNQSHIRIVELSRAMGQETPFLVIVTTPAGRVFERRYAARPSEHAARTDWKNERKTFCQVGDVRIAWVK